jgi:outer membrane receptor protein involved in Fe transport
MRMLTTMHHPISPRGRALRPRHWLMCLLPLLAGPLQAQATVDEDDLARAFGDSATVSIATGSEQSLRRAPAVATVITAEDIARMGATDLDDVMETVPGIHVSRNLQGYNPLYVIRGIYTQFNSQTLMLLNGVPMTMMFIGNRGNAWGGLPLENVARIEVIRGPGSALYGADAYSGVINIITKSASDIDGTELGLRAGSYHSGDAWALHGGKLGPFDVAAYLRAGMTDGSGKTVEADAQTAIDQNFYGTHASLAPGKLNRERDAVDGNLDLAWGKSRLRAAYLLRHNIGLGVGAGSALDNRGTGRTERTLLAYSANDLELSRDWRLNLNLSHFTYDTSYPSPLMIYPAGAWNNAFPNGMFGAPNTWERQLRGSAMVSFSGVAAHQLRLGLGQDDLHLYRTQEFKNFVLHDDGTAPTPLGNGDVVEVPLEDAFMTPQRRKVRYVYAQDEWNLARDWTLTAGVRRDLYSDVGGTTNPRAALVWDASLDVTAKLLYGRAFRAPSFTELYSINNPVLKGNPALKPELINTLEASTSWQVQADTLLQLSLFHYDMKDVINAVGTPQTYQNVGAQRGNGFELEARHDLNRQVRLSGNYAHQKSVDVSTGQDAGYAPHHHLYGRLDWRLSNGMSFSGQINHVAKRMRPPGDTRDPVADYTTVDLTLRTARFMGGWELTTSVRNLFNADAREPSLYLPGNPPPLRVLVPNDLPLDGRTLFVQVSHRL